VTQSTNTPTNHAENKLRNQPQPSHQQSNTQKQAALGTCSSLHPTSAGASRLFEEIGFATCQHCSTNHNQNIDTPRGRLLTTVISSLLSPRPMTHLCQQHPCQHLRRVGGGVGGRDVFVYNLMIGTPCATPTLLVCLDCGLVEQGQQQHEPQGNTNQCARHI